MKTLKWLLAGAVLLGSGPVTAQPAPVSFETWASADHARAVEFAAFQAYLAEQGVGDVAPAFELWRTASSAAACRAPDFVAPPRALWPNVVSALRFVRDHVRPAIGPVEVLSAYRAPALNTCAGGAPHSAHTGYFAIDLRPLDPSVSRDMLTARLCRAHAQAGAAGNIGLGFYSGVRFHIDGMRFRRWGPDGSGATSPCVKAAP